MENNMYYNGSNIWLLCLLPFLIFLSVFSTGNSHISTEFTNVDQCCHKAIQLKTCWNLCEQFPVESYKHCGAIIRINLKKLVKFGSHGHFKSICTLSFDPGVSKLMKHISAKKKPVVPPDVSMKKPLKLLPIKLGHLNGTKSVTVSTATITVAHRTHTVHRTQSARFSATTYSMQLSEKPFTELPTADTTIRTTVSPDQHNIVHTPVAFTWPPVLTTKKQPSESLLIFTTTAAPSSNQGRRRTAKGKKDKGHSVQTGSRQSKLKTDVRVHKHPQCGTSCYATTRKMTLKSDVTQTPKHSVSHRTTSHTGLASISISPTYVPSASQRTHIVHETRRVGPSAPTNSKWLSVMARKHVTDVPHNTATKHKTPHLHHMKSAHRITETMVHTPVGFTQATVMASESLPLERSSTVVSTSAQSSKHDTVKNFKDSEDTFYSVLGDSIQPTSAAEMRPYTDSQYHPSSLSAVTSLKLASDVETAPLLHMPSSQPILTYDILSGTASPSIPASQRTENVHSARSTDISTSTSSMQVSVITVKHFKEVLPTTSAMFPDLYKKTGQRVQHTVLHTLTGSVQPPVMTSEKLLSKSPSTVVTSTSAPSLKPDIRKNINGTDDPSHSDPIGSVQLTLTTDMAPLTSPQCCSSISAAEMIPKSESNHIHPQSVSLLSSSSPRLNDGTQSVSPSSSTLTTSQTTYTAKKAGRTRLFAATSYMQESIMTTKKHHTVVLPTVAAASPDLHNTKTDDRMVETVPHTLRSVIHPPVMITEKPHSGTSPTAVTPTSLPSSKPYGTKTVETGDASTSVLIGSMNSELTSDARPYTDPPYCSSCLNTKIEQMTKLDVSHIPHHSMQHLAFPPEHKTSIQSVTASPSVLITSQRNHRIRSPGISAATSSMQLPVTITGTAVPHLTTAKSADLYSMKTDYIIGDAVSYTLRSSLQPPLTTEKSPSESLFIAVTAASLLSSRPDTRKNIEGKEDISNSVPAGSAQKQTDSEAATTVIIHVASTQQSPKNSMVHNTAVPFITEQNTFMNDKVEMMPSTLSSPKQQEQSTLQAMTTVLQAVSNSNNLASDSVNPALRHPNLKGAFTGQENKNDDGSQKDKIIFLLLGVLLALVAVFIYSGFKWGKMRQTQYNFNEDRCAHPLVGENRLLIPYILNMEHIAWKNHPESSSTEAQSCMTPEQECQTPLLLDNNHMSNEAFLENDTKL
ncbi:mucin-3A-like [Protopterus annectens]|uniref:mucin-3A-like n=1 Tax=Protopterus annectens TaxID=7888 RepID=UPI001CFAF3E0|nr:mucin-3A-like [Protopterus annectens]